MDTKTAEKPRQGYRRTSFMIRPDQWAWLQHVQRETGASPSFTLRKLIDGKAKQSPRNPAA
jgi:hypothetical protein